VGDPVRTCARGGGRSPTALGFRFNPKFTDSKTACMIANEEAFVML
jgi:predicted lactoylglutathione lyase